ARGLRLLVELVGLDVVVLLEGRVARLDRCGAADAFAGLAALFAFLATAAADDEESDDADHHHRGDDTADQRHRRPRLGDGDRPGLTGNPAPRLRRAGDQLGGGRLEPALDGGVLAAVDRRRVLLARRAEAELEVAELDGVAGLEVRNRVLIAVDPDPLPPLVVDHLPLALVDPDPALL